MFVGLFTELSSIGGIQQMSRHAGAVLHQFAQARKQSCQLLSLNDSSGIGTFRVGAASYPFLGFARSKVKLLSHMVRLAPRLRLVYLGHPHLAPLGLLLGLANPRLGYLVAVHGVEVWEPLSSLRRLALRRARGITSVSAFTAKQMQKTQGLNLPRISVLHPALDPDFTNFESEQMPLSLSPGSRVILTVGRLISTEPGKGVDTVIRALPRLLEDVPDLYYVVVGDGDARPQLEDLAGACRVRERVLFAGEQKLQALRGYYCRSDVFAMPSRQEGFGVVYLEAMAYGKPVIAGNHGGAPEVVREGATGFLVEYGDVDAVVERLGCLLRDARLRARMGEAGRRLVQQEYSFEQFQLRLEKLLEEAC